MPEAEAERGEKKNAPRCNSGLSGLSLVAPGLVEEKQGEGSTLLPRSGGAAPGSGQLGSAGAEGSWVCREEPRRG